MPKDGEQIDFVERYFSNAVVGIASLPDASLLATGLTMLVASKGEFVFPPGAKNAKPMPPLCFEAKIAALAKLLRYHDTGSYSGGWLKEFMKDTAVFCARKLFNCYPEKRAELAKREYALLLCCKPKSDALAVAFGMEIIRQCRESGRGAVLESMQKEKKLPYVLRASAAYVLETTQLPNRQDIDAGMSVLRRMAAKFGGNCRFQKNIRMAFPGQQGLSARRASLP